MSCTTARSPVQPVEQFFLGELSEFQEPTNITMMDPPQHTELCARSSSAGSPAGRSGWPRHGSVTVVDELDAMLAAGQADLSTDFGLLTTQVIARLVGVPAAARRRW